jgi:hypothetical protein
MGPEVGDRLAGPWTGEPAPPAVSACLRVEWRGDDSAACAAWRSCGCPGLLTAFGPPGGPARGETADTGPGPAAAARLRVESSFGPDSQSDTPADPNLDSNSQAGRHPDRDPGSFAHSDRDHLAKPGPSVGDVPGGARSDQILRPGRRAS